nr:MAG TPA: hypothetical protein [Bacteriophage sp.]
MTTYYGHPFSTYKISRRPYLHLLPLQDHLICLQ